MSQQKYSWIPGLSGVAIGLLFLGVSDTARAQTVTLTGPGITNNTLNVTVKQGGVSAAIPVTIGVTENGSSIQSTVNVVASSPGNFLQLPGGNNLDVGTPATLNLTVNATNLTTGTQQNGTVTVSLLSNPSIQQVLNVVVTVTGSSLLSSSPASLSFSTIAGTPEANVPAQVLTIASSGTQLSYTVTTTTQTGGFWLVPFNTTGTTGSAATDTISVGINLTPSSGALSPNVYQGSITVLSTTTGDSVVINVTLTVAANTTLSVTPATLQPFLYQTGTVPQTGQLTQTLQASSTGSSVQFQVTMNPPQSWLVVTSNGATGSGGGAVPITFSVNPTGLGAAVYNTQVTISIVNGASLPAIPVQLVVSTTPLLSLSATSLSFVSSFSGGTPASQAVQVSTIPSSAASVGFTVSSDPSAPWLTWTAPSLNTPGTITVSVNPSSLAVGSHTGQLTVTPNNGLYSLPIVVTLTVGNAAQVSAGPPLLVFSWETTQPAPQAQLVELLTVGQATTFSLASSVTASANCPAGWLTATSGSSSTQGATITVSVSVTGMLPGVCPGTVTVSYPANSQTPQTLMIPVAVEVSNSALLNISMPLGFGTFTVAQGAPQLTQAIQLTSTDPATQVTDITASSSSNGPSPWLFLGSNGASTPQALQVIISAGSLPPNTYAGTISISSSKLPSSPLSIPVTLTVTSTTTVAISPTTLTFNEALNGSLPTAQSVTLTSSAAGATFQASPPSSQVCSWLQVVPTSGAATGPVTFTVLQNSLPQNSYACPVTFTFLNSASAPITVTATLVVGPGQTLTATPASLTFAYQVAGATPASQPLTLTSTQGSVAFTASATSNGGWLLIDTTASATGPALSRVINVSINPANFPAGTVGGSTLTGQITINAPPVLATPITVVVTVNVTAAQVPTPVTIINSAIINGFGAIAPGELIAIKGTNLGPGCVAPATGCVSGGFQFTVAQGAVGSTLSGVQVLFDTIPGTPTFVSPTQINVIVPWEIAGRVATNMVVTYNSVQSAAFPLQVVAVAPGIYTQNATGSGQSAALNLSAQAASAYNGPAGGTYVGTSIATAPAPQGSVIVLYLTGGGLTNPGSTDGSISSNTTLMPLKNWTLGSSVVTATVGNSPATVLFAGAAPTLITGVVQINLQLPAGVTGNALPVVITIDGVTTQTTATIAVQ